MLFRKSAAGLLAAAALCAAQAQAHEVPAAHHAHKASPQPAKRAPKARLKVAAVTKPAPYTAGPQAHHAPAAPAVCVLPAPTEREIAVLFEVWNAALQTGSPELVASLYAPDGVLLPTVSNKVRTNRAEITEYFKHFLELHPRGAVKEQHIRILSPDLALNAGGYTFDIMRDGKPEQVTARYDFLYKRVNGRWLIADHHSSKMPEAVTAAPVVQAAAH